MPDLTVKVTKMIVADDYVTVHITFQGRFTGSFGGTKARANRSTLLRPTC